MGWAIFYIINMRKIDKLFLLPLLICCFSLCSGSVDEDSYPEEKPDFISSLVTQNASNQSNKVFEFLKNNYQHKFVSGTMAKVDWNIDEAEQVYKWSGKYPAMNGFDYIHHVYSSTSGWIDYEDISVVENWWKKNGLVTIMWHWNVPVSENSTQYAFYYTGRGGGSSETSFDISKAVINGTYENAIVKADLDIIAGYLLLLKKKDIPVIWRPLHEAAGGWFWWGAKDPDSYKALWKLMFDTFAEKGLNNLIWVWTTETNDADWYPGDDYVDLIGRDIYYRSDAYDLAKEYKAIMEKYPTKIIALSECGNVAGIVHQWNAGASWSWYMPWYDYNGSDNSHIHATKEFWTEALSSEKVITRDQMPDLK